MKRKHIIIGGIVLVVLILIILISRMDLGMKNPWLDGVVEDATKGDLVIPVTATGTVVAAKLIEIKSKASGEVAAIHVVEGQMVKTGDVLVELNPVDEKRRLEGQQAELKRATAALEKAKAALESYTLDLPLQTKSAEAKLTDAAARLKDAEFKWNKMKGYMEGNVAGEVEGVTTESSYLISKANRDLAEVDLLRARNNERILLKSAGEDVRQAEAAFVQAQKLLDEAKLRLDETTVRAKSDAMVYSLKIREGEMIQSGTQSLMGGTQLGFLADTSAMFVTALIDEADIGSIREIAPKYARPGKTVKLSEEIYRAQAERALGEQPTSDPAEPDMTVTRDGPDVSGELGLAGLPVEVTVEAYRSQKYRGVIERILPEPQRVNNAVAFYVRIRLVGPELDKLMGLQADLSFTTAKLHDVVLVKNEALHSEGRDCFVYVPIAGKPRSEEKRPVTIGTTDGTFTEVKAGINAGDRVYLKRPQKTEKEKEEEKKGAAKA
jgi:multidrug efflux pump subunit AcrA (membrane-fusion protein)